MAQGVPSRIARPTITPCIITRPYAAGLRDVATLQTHGITAQAVPLHRIRLHPLALSISQLTAYEGVIFTSPRGLMSLSEGQRAVLRHKVLYGVGVATAKVLENEGFTIGTVAPTVQHLIAHFRSHPPRQPLLYLRGQEVQTPLVGAIDTGVGQGTCQIDEQVTYELEPLSNVVELLTALITTAPKSVVLLQSVAAARYFSALLPPSLRCRVHCLCQSQRIRAICENKGFDSLSCAQQPTGLSLLQKTRDFFKNA